MPTEATRVPTSFVIFHTRPSAAVAERDEVFLLYSKGTEEGMARGIHRDGIGSPWMWDEDAKRKITDAEQQRRGTWLIDRKLAIQCETNAIEKKRNSPEARKRLEQEFQRNADEVINEWIAELNGTPDYLSEFEKIYDGHNVVGMQGCGNLTMNSWFVWFCKLGVYPTPPHVFVPSRRAVSGT